METIEDINVALLQLRENLANLDAARLQVAQVTGSSQELVEATARLSDEVKRLADRISEETQAVISRFAEQLEGSRAEWTDAINDGKARFATEVEQTRQATALLKSDAELALQQDLHTVGRRPEIGDAGDASSGYLRRDTGRRRLEVGNPRDAPPSHRLRSPNRGGAEG